MELSPEQYIASAKKRVPRENRTTAILYVDEMLHMPQASLLAAVLPHMLRTCLAWKAAAKQSVITPLAELQALLEELTENSSWSGRLMFTNAGLWADVPFGNRRSTLLGRRPQREAKAKHGWA
eukprot:gb/GFBE01078063.1/.p1 GENE.gb/GFBE01078063.1/~~gb/GFBE01078063.1/.p1  ORF type:complete len:123 (+),score=23.74 gb/GFBE01078063.1/:1-369(+)